jgi:ubiquitin-like protein Pup
VKEAIMSAAAETVRKGKQAPSPEAGTHAGKGGNLSERGAALRKNIDEVLSDIDDILEENAEEFVKEFVQRGGE